MPKLKPGPIQSKWLQSLKDHPERQMKFQLGKGTPENYKACCLGELALIAGIARFENGKLKSFDSYGNQSLGGIKDFEAIGSLGEAEFYYATPSLSLLNDSRISWPEIAKYVEENFDAYFTKSV
jgi:hypothetical protein